MGTSLRRMFPAMAVASLVTALLAVTMGGVVRVTGSGLGCPDWPLCYGQVIPPWELTSWLEYLHRLSAAVAGAFTFLMVVSGFARYGTRGATMHLVLVSGVLIVIQAGFGAYTVLSELSPGVALIHTAIATSLVGVLAVIVARTTEPFRPQSVDVVWDHRWDRFPAADSDAGRGCISCYTYRGLRDQDGGGFPGLHVHTLVRAVGRGHGYSTLDSHDTQGCRLPGGRIHAIWPLGGQWVSNTLT